MRFLSQGKNRSSMRITQKPSVVFTINRRSNRLSLGWRRLRVMSHGCQQLLIPLSLDRAEHVAGECEIRRIFVNNRHGQIDSRVIHENLGRCEDPSGRLSTWDERLAHKSQAICPATRKMCGARNFKPDDQCMRLTINRYHDPLTQCTGSGRLFCGGLPSRQRWARSSPTAFFTTVFERFPVAGPFLAPSHHQAATNAHFLRQL